MEGRKAETVFEDLDFFIAGKDMPVNNTVESGRSRLDGRAFPISNGDGEGYGPDKTGGHFPVTKEYQDAEDDVKKLPEFRAAFYHNVLSDEEWEEAKKELLECFKDQEVQ